MKIVVVTGTGPAFSRLIDGMARYARNHPEVEVWAQHGAASLPPPLKGLPLVPRSELLDRLRAADAVVCHAGTGSLADALASGHVPVVIPRLSRLGEAVNDHQLEIAMKLGTEGRVVVVDDMSGVGDAITRSRTMPRGTGSPGSVALQEAVAREIYARTRRQRRTTRAVWWLLGLATIAVRPRRSTHR